MGIPSFTKYLETRTTQYFQKYELFNSSLVIDGHSVGNNLYNWQYTYWRTGFSPYCYGGDYDKYAEIVKFFFHLLLECNVTPYIVFDGCNENDKAALIKQRLNEKVKINSEITPTLDHHKYTLGAVALKYAFQDVVAELQLKAFTCLSDANRKMASLAKYLKCPVLSADSDFFVSSALLIPFSSIDHILRESSDHKYNFINCKLYKIENLIDALNNRPNMHYLIPVLLGNNQFKTEIFNSFFKRFKIYGGRQKIVESIFQWLKRQNTLEIAINEVVKTFASVEQKSTILKIIKHTIMAYTPVSVASLLEHFEIEVNQNHKTPEESSPVNFEKLATTFGINIEDDIDDIQVPELFKHEYTKCQYPAFFMDMLKNNRYFVWPNIEDCSKPDANSIGYNIMSAIHNILVQTEEKQLTVLKRNINNKLEEFILPPFKNQLPSIEEIEYLNVARKQDLLFEILEIDQSFCHIFEKLPKEWHLFILALKYATSKSKFHSSFIYSLMFCFISLNYVDLKLKGFYRSVEDLKSIGEVSQNNDATVVEDQNKFSAITESDCFIFMQKCIKYFEMNPKDNADTYDRGIMHSMAEFQCVFLHLKYLNILLNCPLKDSFIYRIFNGTFTYNMTKILENKTSLKDFLNMFLKDCFSIQDVLVYVTALLEEYSIC